MAVIEFLRVMREYLTSSGDLVMQGADPADTMTFREDASLLFGGDATMWDDLAFPLTQTRQGALSKPDFDYTRLGYLFPQNNPAEITYIIGQMPHKWLEGSAVYPHMHYLQEEATLPTFKLDYKIYNVGADAPGSWTTIALTEPIGTPYTGNDMHQILSSVAPIDMTGLTLSCIMDLKLYRDDNDVSGDVLGKDFDFHYQINTLGSRQEYIK